MGSVPGGNLLGASLKRVSFAVAGSPIGPEAFVSPTTGMSGCPEGCDVLEQKHALALNSESQMNVTVKENCEEKLERSSSNDRFSCASPGFGPRRGERES